MLQSHITTAVKKARQSACKHKVSALGFNRNGDCVAKATNLQRFNKQGGGIHAEMRIMAQARRKGVKTILICRVGKSGIKPLHPCPVCARKARSLGLKIITIQRGEYNENHSSRKD